MSTQIRLFKRNMKTGYALGACHDSWAPYHVRIDIPYGRCYIVIEDGMADTIPVYNKATGEPIPALEIAKEILKQNRFTISVGSKGAAKKMHYGEKWFFDYDSNIREFFEENKLDIPEDGKSYGQRMQDIALGNLEAQGLIQKGMGTKERVSVGQQAIQQAKDNQEAQKIKELEAKLAEAEKAKADLEAAKEQPKVEEKPAKKAAKKKEEAKEVAAK